MSPPAQIEIPPEVSRDLILGQLVQAVNSLIKTNREEHDRIFARLDESEKYLFVFKASRCSFDWLSRNGFLKWSLLCSACAAIGWVAARIW